MHRILIRKTEMVALMSCEILDGLKKLGINPSAELIEYVIEYTAYYSMRLIQLESSAD